MVTLGSDPGVQITATAGTVGGISVGRAQYLVLVGVGNDSASAATNEPIDINSRSDAKQKFGDGSDIVRAYNQARRNGANRNYIKAVMAETTTSEESFTSTSTGTFADAPVVGGTGTVTFVDSSDSTELDPVPRFETPVAAPSDDATVHYNPNTGEWATASSGSYDATYQHADWATAATDGVTRSLQDGEFGLIHPLCSAESVAAEFESVIADMREEIKMVNLAMPAEPNATTSDGYARIDAPNYSDDIANDNVFLFGPASERETTTDNPLYGHSLAPSVAGIFAGNDVNDPVYGDLVEGAGELGDQHVSRSDVADMRASYVIPIRDVGDVRIKDNLSTYDQEEEGGWERDFFTRRVVDMVIALADRLGQNVLGDITDADAISDLQEQLVVELDDLVDLGLLVPGGQFVEVYEVDQNTIGVDLAVTPQGVAKSVQVDLTIAV